MSTPPIIGFLVTNAVSTQLTLYTVVMISMWLAETILLGGPASEKWRHSSGNALLILAVLPVQIVMTRLYMATSGLVTEHRWGLLNLLPNADGPLVRFGLGFLLLDFLDYVYHVAMHQVPALWRFHLLHHTDRQLDVSTTVREHPGETFIRNCFLILWVLLSGASPEVLILRQTAETIANILAHTALRLPHRPARWLGWLLVTPNVHQVHHHFSRPATNCNYGDVFSLWDRLFGTWMEMEADELLFGLDSHMARSP